MNLEPAVSIELLAHIELGVSTAKNGATPKTGAFDVGTQKDDATNLA